MNKYWILFFTIMTLLACDKEDKFTANKGSWKIVTDIFPQGIFPGLTGRIDPFTISGTDIAFFGLGYAGIAPEDNIWYRDIHIFIKDKWADETIFPGRPRRQASGFIIDGKLYVGLGNDENGLSGASYRDLWCYDPAQQTWDSLPYEFPGEPRIQAVTFSTKGKGYIGTGIGSHGYLLAKNGKMWQFIP